MTCVCVQKLHEEMAVCWYFCCYYYYYCSLPMLDHLSMARDILQIKNGETFYASCTESNNLSLTSFFLSVLLLLSLTSFLQPYLATSCPPPSLFLQRDEALRLYSQFLLFLHFMTVERYIFQFPLLLTGYYNDSTKQLFKKALSQQLSFYPSPTA